MPITRALAASKKWGGAALLGIAFFTTAARSSAQQPSTSTSAPAPRRTVDLLIRSTPAEDTRALEDTIRELLSRLSITVVNRANGVAPAPGSLLATVDVDLVDPNGAHVVVRSATRSVVLDRTIPRDSNPAILREQIASTVRGATEAEILVDEDRVAGRAPPVVDEPPAPAPAPAPAPPAPAAIDVEKPAALPAEQGPLTPSSSSFAINLSTFAGGGMFADESPVVRVGGSVGIVSRRAGELRPGFAIAALYTFPFESGDRTLEARASVASLRALPMVEVFRTPRFALDFAGGGGIDVLTVDPASKVLPESAFPEGKTTRVNPILTGGVTGRLALASDVALMITLMTDVDLTTRRYVFDDRGLPRDVLVPWTVRPMLLAGLTFTAFGSGGGKGPSQ